MPHLAVSRLLIVASVLSLSSRTGYSQTLPPALFYSDLESGPNSGGQNNQGAFVTVYGKGFGQTQGASYITIGGGTAAAYLSWTDTKISLQIGLAAQTGNIVVNTSAGASNPIPFTVRPGNIYFVATTGNDNNNGSFSTPWQTALKARDTIAPGDIAYLRNGVSQSTNDGKGWYSCFTIAYNSGTAGKPKAIVAYPGETATIGNPNLGVCGVGIRSEGTGNENYWVFAGLILRGESAAIEMVGSNWRMVGNDMSCPNGNGETGCFEASVSSYAYLYGNNVHNVGTNYAPTAVTALYQGVYFSTDTNHVWFGWNTIAYVQGCRGLQTNSSPLEGGGATDPTGNDMYDIHIHDNIIHDTQCDGMIIATVDPSQGPVEIYNNLIYHVGTGPSNMEGSGAWNCMNLQAYSKVAPSPGSGTIQVYNNTMYDCGSNPNPNYNGSSGGVLWGGQNTTKNVGFHDNIIYMTENQPYLTIYSQGGTHYCADSENCPGIEGSNNIFFGNGPAPTNTNITSSLNLNPSFVGATQSNFHLNVGSPAAIAGVSTSAATDFDGVPLPQGSGYPIGAYALPTGVSPPPPTLSLSPSSISLTPGGTEQFTPVTTGAVGAISSWSVSPSVGTVSASGVYTAPASILSAQSVSVTATIGSQGLSATATVNLVPVTVSVAPSSITLTANQTHQFSSSVTGIGNGAVTWSLNPAVGTVSTTGLYTAPSSVATQQTVIIKAVSVAVPSAYATATITLAPPAAVVQVSVNPTSSSLLAGQTSQFTATVTGSSNTAVTWTLSPTTGTLSSSGLYTAPSSVTTQQVVTVKATSVADPTKFASATVTLMPTPVVAVSVNPSSVSLSALQTQQFTATVTGSSNTAVTWTLSPNTGTISASGLYTAPSVSAQQVVTVKAVSSADPTKSGTAAVTLLPTLRQPQPQTTVSCVQISNTAFRVTWNAPLIRGNDWIGLSSPNAPTWWNMGVVNTNGAATGSQTIVLPTTPGIYQCRYYAADQFAILALSSPFSVAANTFKVTPSSNLASTGSALTVSWQAGAGRTAGDYIGLYRVGAPTDQPLAWSSTGGLATGTLQFQAPKTAGPCEFRYVLGAPPSYTYITVTSAGLSVQ